MHLSHSAVVELTAKNLFRGSESSVSQLEIGPRTHARRHTQRHGWVVGWSVAHPPTRNMEVGGGVWSATLRFLKAFPVYVCALGCIQKRCLFR